MEELIKMSAWYYNLYREVSIYSKGHVQARWLLEDKRSNFKAVMHALRDKYRGMRG